MKTINKATRKINEKTQKIIRAILFISIFCLLFVILTKIFWIRPTAIKYFYQEPKNSLDVVYIGGSNVTLHFNALLAYDKYGYTTGALSSENMPFQATQNLIIETEKYQHPKLYVIDLAKLGKELTSIDTVGIRRVTDSMKPSKNRIDAINNLLSYTDVKKEDYITYYYSFLMYHEAWKTPTSIYYNIFGNKSYYKGFLMRKQYTKGEAIEELDWPTEALDADNSLKEVFDNLFEYVTENNLNILFVVPSRTFANDDAPYRINGAINYIEENGFKVINFNNLENFSVDYQNDFTDYAHLNTTGATKYTLYFSKYLYENYNLPNHNDDSKYKSWIKEYDRLKSDYKKYTKKDYEDVVKELDIY